MVGVQRRLCVCMRCREDFQQRRENCVEWEKSRRCNMHTCNVSLGAHYTNTSRYKILLSGGIVTDGPIGRKTAQTYIVTVC